MCIVLGVLQWAAEHVKRLRATSRCSCMGRGRAVPGFQGLLTVTNAYCNPGDLQSTLAGSLEVDAITLQGVV